MNSYPKKGEQRRFEAREYRNFGHIEIKNDHAKVEVARFFILGRGSSAQEACLLHHARASAAAAYANSRWQFASFEAQGTHLEYSTADSTVLKLPSPRSLSRGCTVIA